MAVMLAGFEDECSASDWSCWQPAQP